MRPGRELKAERFVVLLGRTELGGKVNGPDTYIEGRPCWIDLSTSDLGAAQEFYGGLFDWEFDAEPAGGGYVMALSRGQAVAGLAKGPDGDTPVWTTYLAVDDAAATVDRARAAGGNVLVDPMVVGPAGRMAYLLDPTGAAIGLWEGDAHKGAAIINEPGAYTWAELHSEDADAVAGFYNALVGLEAQQTDLGDDRLHTVLRVGGATVGGTTPPVEGVPPHWHVYFGATDTDAICAAATARGGETMAWPHDTPVGRVATISDPQGATFSVITLNEWPQ